MRDFMWENMNMKPIKLEEITPEKLIEIEQYAQEVRLEQLTLAQLKEISEQREVAIATLSQIEMDCKMRAMRARSLGFSKAELARIFNVNNNTITKWVGK